MRTKMRETSRSSIWATARREIIVHHSLLGGMQQEFEIHVHILKVVYHSGPIFLDIEKTPPPTLCSRYLMYDWSYSVKARYISSLSWAIIKCLDQLVPTFSTDILMENIPTGQVRTRYPIVIHDPCDHFCGFLHLNLQLEIETKEEVPYGMHGPSCDRFDISLIFPWYFEDIQVPRIGNSGCS